MQINSTNQSSERERVARSYLLDLGLIWKQLKGKGVLDIGAGSGGFAEVAKIHGVEVISVDKYLGGMEKHSVPTDIQYVVSGADSLPFEDSSFDLVVARAVVHSLDKKQIEVVIKEVKRVLKAGGEFRFGPGSLNAGIFAKEGFFKRQILNHNDPESLDRRLKLIANLSIEYLKKLDPKIAVKVGNPKREKYNNTYYLLSKK